MSAPPSATIEARARLAADNVACVRGERLLFERLSFALGPGEAALASGPNGAGKTSLLRLCAGLLRSAAGTIARDGRIAAAFEQPALDEQATLADALGFWRAIDGADAAAGASALAAMDLDDLAAVPVRMLSTGQRRRATIARVIASGAAIWLLDEPANGLDTASIERLEHAIAAHRAGGGIVLAASHQPLALPGARRIALA